MGKNKKNNQQKYQPTISAPSAAKSPAMSEAEKTLFELFKATVGEDGQGDIKDFIKLHEEMYEEEFGKKMSEIDGEVEEQKKRILSDYETQIQTEHKDTVEETERLRKEVSELEKKKEGLEKERKKIIDDAESEAKKKVEQADAVADGIKKKAEEEAEQTTELARKKLDERESGLNERESALNERESGFDEREMEFGIREKALGAKERKVEKLAAVYEVANPEELKTLQAMLAQKDEQIKQIMEEFQKVQGELTSLKLQQIKLGDTTPEQLLKEKEQLLAQIKVLQEKCDRYTDYDLSEMERALEQEKEYITQINNLHNEVNQRKTEEVRLRNGMMEYEQLRAQMDMLRTLNEHLRTELDNTKRMLESSVGEICPALTSIDADETSETGDSFNRFEDRNAARNSGELTNLHEVVEHIRTYAASQEKPLFYSEEDISAFIAGMSASPIAILQGMSGTGKTSLPKIVAEALWGEINVVPVESSWRDRNELLGYYNDFSKKFTAKEFTCDLYRAGCERYRETIYFIVLDEMNLSRVEYYFADFLSVLEDKKDKWLIKLVDTDMRQLPTEITREVRNAIEKDKSLEAQELLKVVDILYPSGKLDDSDTSSVTAAEKQSLIMYLTNKKFKNSTGTRSLVGGPEHLLNGNTIKIPRNVWFIGTANRDESTFEITDKVYDRAQVLNFNNRANGSKIDDDIDAIYLTYDELVSFFDKARRRFSFAAEKDEVLKKVEAVLKNYFRISYGNRIQDQMNLFVPVYVAARVGSTNPKEDEIRKYQIEAIDYQLTNKVLRKLEYEEIRKDPADELRKVFEQYGMKLAKDFLKWKTDGNEG